MRWFVLSLIVLASCTKTIYVPVVQSHTVIDTVVQTSQDSTLFRALFECDSSGRVMLKELNSVKGKMARQSVEFENNELKVKTQWQTKFIERMVEVRDTLTIVDVRKVTESKPYIPKFFWGCFAVTLMLFLWGVFRVAKLFL